MSQAIFELIPLIMQDVGAVEKSRKNAQQGYSFRGIDDLYRALQGPLARHGVFFAPKVVNATREERASKSGGQLIYTVLTVEFTFYAKDGSNFSVTTLGEAMDSGDKSANKAMSTALKYALLQLFCIPTEEDKDTENHSPEVAPQERPPGLTTVKPIVPPPVVLTESRRAVGTIAGPSGAQVARLFAIARSAGWSEDDVRRELMSRYQFESTKSLDKNQYDELCRIVGQPRGEPGSRG